MPSIYTSQDNERNTRRVLPRTFRRYNLDDRPQESRYEHRHQLVPFSISSTGNSSDSSSSSSSSSSGSGSGSSSENSMDDSMDEEDDITRSDDEDTITESFARRVDIYRLAIRTNSEILEDLAAIIRILRQINAIYRVFTNHRGRPLHRRHIHDDDDTDEDDDDDEDDEANKLLEAGLEDLQSVLTTENTGGIKRQSTLALLALITYQYNHCSDKYLRQYLDPNGNYNPALAIFAAATYDEEEDDSDQPPKSCKDIMVAAEELYGPDWLDEFHKGKEGALRKMLEKLTFVAQIRSKVRESSLPIIR